MKCRAAVSLLLLFFGSRIAPAANPPPPSPPPVVSINTPQVKAKLETIRRAGFPTNLVELERWSPMPPPQENAALVYLRAFSLLVRRDGIEVPSRNTPLSANEQGRIASALEANQAARLQLREAARLPRSRYPTRRPTIVRDEAAYLAAIREASTLLRAESALYSQTGQPDLAAESVMSLLALAHSLDQEPDLVSQNVRIVLSGDACCAAERLLNQHQLSEATLAALQIAFRDAENPNGLTRAFVGDRCGGIQVFQSQREKVYALAGLKSSLDPMEASRKEVEHLKVSGERDFLFYLDTMGQCIAAVRQPFPECRELLRKINRRIADEHATEISHPRSLTCALISDYQAVPDTFATQAARLRVTQAALAIERYRLANRGQLPATLDALVPGQAGAVPYDPFTSGSVLYLTGPRGYVVYSVGVNGRDDKGAESKSKDASAADITCTVTR